ncbi:MAG: HEAT repeat domain-containing protein [Candidatus Eremiobacteraeota bacterium]|nr:HEAT repeat domain-containing protein [Candidatus Eremiobacteraeota bacterium]
MRVVLLALLWLLAAAASSSAPSTQPIAIETRLFQPTVWLDAPAWVEMRITNVSSRDVVVDVGVKCPWNLEQDITVPQASGATQRRDSCGVPGGSCIVPFPTRLAPGETLLRRYVVVGDFHISRPGDYTVLFTHAIRYAWAQPSTVRPDDAHRDFESQHEALTVRSSLTLHVLSAAPGAVLAVEKSLAQDAAAKALPSTPLPQSSDAATRERLLEKRADQEYADLLRRWSIAQGLAEYPVVGMEQIFADWLRRGVGVDDWAFPALQRLNTPAARSVLAQVVTSKIKAGDARDQSHRFVALDELSEMGDKAYLPLFVSLVNDGYRDVRVTAIRGLALLGGDSEVPMLAKLARGQRSSEDRAETLEAIGEARSRRAIPLLIAFFSLPDANQPTSSNDALFRLTHHSISSADLSTVEGAKVAWERWWAANKGAIHVFGPFDCPT